MAGGNPPRRVIGQGVLPAPAAPLAPAGFRRARCPLLGLCSARRAFRALGVSRLAGRLTGLPCLHGVLAGDHGVRVGTPEARVVYRFLGLPDHDVRRSRDEGHLPRLYHPEP